MPRIVATLGEAKTLGGVGALLVLIGGFVGTSGALLIIIGFILILIATNYISQFTTDAVFSNMLIAVVIAIIGSVIFEFTVVSAIYSFIGSLGGTGSLTNTNAPQADFSSLLSSVIIALVVGWVFFLTASVFLKRSYDLIGKSLGIGSFHTAGLLYLIGAALTIVFGIGLIVVVIAEVFQVVAFFSIPEKMTKTSPQQMPRHAVPPPPFDFRD